MRIGPSGYPYAIDLAAITAAGPMSPEVLELVKAAETAAIAALNEQQEE